MAVKRRPRRDHDEEPVEEEERPRRSRRDEDDEPEERPARRSSRARDDDEDEDEERPPRRSRRSRDDDDDDEEDEKPRRSRRAREDDDDEEDERPSRRRRSRDDEDDDSEDDEDDDRPRRPKKSSVRKGWKGVAENKAKGGDFAQELKVGEEPDLFKFLEDEPVASYRQHWVDNPVGTKKKSWTCLEDPCPLCDVGDRPRQLTVFNILHLNTGGPPENKILVIGNQALTQLKNFADDDKTGPLTKLYWAVSKPKKGGYNWQPVKERDLEEDWDVAPLEEDELEEALEKMYDDTCVYIPSRRDMQVQADAWVGDDDEEDEKPRRRRSRD